MATTTSPTGGRSPATPASSVSSVRDLISRLEKSGGNEKETNKGTWKDREKITTGRVSASHIQPLSPTDRPRDIQRPVPITIAPALKIEATEKPTDRVPKIMPKKATEIVVKTRLDNDGKPTQNDTAVDNLKKAAEKDVRKQTDEAVAKAPVKSLGEMFEKISLKRPTSPKAAHSPILPSPTAPFSPTRSLFPRNCSPVRRTSATTASLSAVVDNKDEPHSTPATPSWRCRQFSGDHHDRASLVSTSPSLPTMVTRPITPATPRTPTTPSRSTAKYSETPEDYSLTLLRYKAYFERPLARSLDGDSKMVEEAEAEAVVGGKEKEVYETTSRRQGKDVDAFWAPVRQYLLITDEELYDS